MTTYESLFFNSKQTGAITDNNGGSFSLHFDNNFIIPSTASQCYIRLMSASIWNTFKNIDVNNNKLHYVFKKESAPGNGLWNYTPQTITFLPGLYDFDDLKIDLERQMKQQYLHPADWISITALTQSEKILFNIDSNISILTSNVANQSIADILGYNYDLILDGSIAQNGDIGKQIDFLANNVAKFNPITAINIESSLGQSYKNGKLTNVIAQFSLSSSGGFLDNHEIIHPMYINASHLIGNPIGEIYFRLTDQNGVILDTSGNDWGINILLEYN